MNVGGVAPNFTIDKGFKNIGNGWIDTLFNTSNGANFTQNNSSIFIYIRDNIQSNSQVDIGVINATTVVYANSNNTTNKVFYSLNQAGSSEGSGITDSRGLWHFRRISSTIVEVYHNGALISQANYISLLPVNGNLYLLAFNDVTGTPFYFSYRQIAMAGAGNNTINPIIFYNNVQAYMIAIGANV